MAMLLAAGAAIMPMPGTSNASMTSAETLPTSGGACPQVPHGYDSGGPPRAAFPNDPFLERQWGLDQINAPEAWARAAIGKGALIGLVDTGVDLGHPDPRANRPGAPGPARQPRARRQPPRASRRLPTTAGHGWARNARCRCGGGCRQQQGRPRRRRLRRQADAYPSCFGRSRLRAG